MEDQPDNKAEEPAIPYNKKRVMVFKSFEEAVEADYEFYRNLTPERRMEKHLELSKKVYGESGRNSNWRFSF